MKLVIEINLDDEIFRAHVCGSQASLILSRLAGEISGRTFRDLNSDYFPLYAYGQTNPVGHCEFTN